MSLLDVIRELNPHWRGEPDPRPGFRRHVVPMIGGALACRSARGPVRRAIVLSGLRRVGKSHALRQVVSEVVASGAAPTDVLYYDLSDPRTAGVTVEDVLAETGFLSSRSGHRTLLLDEVGHDPAWTESVKRLVELGPDTPGIVVADSAAARLRPSPAGESAAGRRMDIMLLPMSFREVARCRGLAVEDVRDADAPRLAVLADEYLTSGGMPEVVFAPFYGGPKEWAHARLREDAAMIVAADAQRVREVRNLRAMRMLWAMIARGVVGAVNVSSTATALGVARATVEDFLQTLCDLMLVTELPPSGGGPKAPVRHPPKYAVADPGLAAAHQDPGDAGQPGRRGLLMEAAILLNLKGLEASRPGLTIGYARGAGGEDIDFLVGGMGHAPIAIESKHAASVDPGVLRKATAAAERFGVRQLLLVSRAPEAGRQVFGPMVVRTVPLWRFLMWPEAALREGDDG